MVVSIPEKTLEHWASVYLTYRYRSHGSLWWPAHGEDINVSSLPSLPGKAVQLELKTTYLNSTGNLHRVKVSLSQLDHYLSRPHGQRPFYVFPQPHWTGLLRVAAPADGVPATEVGFRRAETWHYSAKTWWFADWLRALTTDQVAAIVGPQLAAYRAGKSKPDSVVLLTYDLASGYPAATWADGNQHRPIQWLDLWDRLNECGEPSWPQLIRIPATLLPRSRRVRHPDLRDLLARADDPEGDLVTLSSDGDGGFLQLDQVSALPGGDDRGEDEGSVVPAAEHRIAAFLRTAALRLT